MATKKKFQTIDEYIETFPKPVQEILEKIRLLIHETAPEAQEAISYQIPAFKLNDKAIIYFAGFKNHIGLFPPPPQEFRDEVAPYAGPKGNLKFPLDKPVPYDLIRRIVLARVQ